MERSRASRIAGTSSSCVSHSSTASDLTCKIAELGKFFYRCLRLEAGGSHLLSSSFSEVSCASMASDNQSSQLYNKPEHRHTLVGNWQEEQKLLETTGSHRYKVWYRSLWAQNCSRTVK